MIRPVTVQDMLHARDERAARQAEWLERYHQPLISFTMNIAGEIKTDDQIRRAFCEGKWWINAHLSRLNIPVLACAENVAFTGCEALWAVEAESAGLKEQMTAIEESCSLGRLFDIDVISADGTHLSRGTERTCLICGGPVLACARSRAHSAEELFARAQEIIRGHFEGAYARQVAQLAQRALLYEAITTPKPGLVDCMNNGAHRDMDLFSFAASASALGSYFEDCVRIGQRGEPLTQLQHAGILAEEAMLTAAGANTHKGAIFALGILCCALGRCGEGADLTIVFEQAAVIGQCYLHDMAQRNKSATGGEKQYRQYGLTGARGEAASGFRTVLEIALPVLEMALSHGASINEAGQAALLHLMAHVMDSNIIRRADMVGQRWVSEQALSLVQNGYTEDDLHALDAEMIRRNISPGGSADLLAAAWFLYFIKTMGRHSDE